MCSHYSNMRNQYLFIVTQQKTDDSYQERIKGTEKASPIGNSSRVTYPLRPPRLAFAICGWRWQNDVREIKYSVCVRLVMVSYYGYDYRDLSLISNSW